MRNQWLRLLLLLRRPTPSQPSISQVQHLRSFTTALLYPRAPRVSPNTFPLRRRFTSSPELVVEPPKPPSDQAVLLADIFAKSGRSNDEIKLILDDKNIVITHDLILSFLGNPEIDPDVAKRVFGWVSENDSENLSSESYNLMLGILGGNGFVKETWDMIGIMKEKGYRVSKGTFDKISEKFQKDGLNDDVEKLKESYASDSLSFEENDLNEENAIEEDWLTVCEIIRREVWGDDVEKQLRELDVEFSSDLVTRVLENLKMDPNKALIFFRWLQESGVFKHDQRSFNVMARVLGEEDHGQKFWRVIDEMRSEGHEMERETYDHILERFVLKEMINDAVDLYEFAMNGGNKPSVKDCTSLLALIVAREELDMDLFSKVVAVFTANGNAFTDDMLDVIIESLTRVGSMNECNRILVAMEGVGYAPSLSSRCKIAFTLSSRGETAEALEFMDKMVPSSDYRTWESLVEGFCVNGNLDEASRSFQKMVERGGASCAGRPLDLLVDEYFRQSRRFDAYKFIRKMVDDKVVSPALKTYRTLTSGLLEREHFKEALDVMTMMKNQGYPPYLGRFIEYLSKNGSAEDAIKFTQAMTSKRYPPTSVFLRLFEAYLTAGRQSEAQDFLSKCPRHIKNHADILDLFSSRNSGVTRTADVAA